jgi:glycosyltransferase involved in cell wall biosynthesis
LLILARFRLGKRLQIELVRHTSPKPELWADCAVLIPAHNEEDSVAETVAACRSLGCGEVLVVENGSTDATVERARAGGATVLQLPTAGYGRAVAAGQAHLSRRWAWTLVVSADGSDAFAPGEAALWAQVAQRSDLVLGDRTTIPAARAHLTSPQLWGSRVFSVVVRLAWGHRFCDMGSRRLIRNARWEELWLREFQFGWNAEMQVRAVEAGWRITELAASYHPRLHGCSKISGTWRGSWRAALGILGCLNRLYWTRGRVASLEPLPVETPT